MLLGFKTELKVNKQQRILFAKHSGVSRHAWNWGLGLTKQILDHNKAFPKSKIKFPTAIDLHKWLVALVKPECPWYYECSKTAPQEALRALRTAWDRCFKKTSGVPRFKKKGKQDSFTLEGAVKILCSNKIQVPKIGVLKTYERLPQVQPKSVTIGRQADRWFISFRFDVEQKVSENTSVVGVDLGVKSLATLSTGGGTAGAKSYRKYESRLSRLQWLNRHKEIGSNNWKLAQIRIARLHRKIANIRKDTLHKLTSLLAKNHGTVVIEDRRRKSRRLPPAGKRRRIPRLNVSGMLSLRKLAKAIADMGFYEFRRQLTYKCELYGSKLVVVDRWFPSSKTCSNCGTLKETLSLDERLFDCLKCGFSLCRDLNAAINLSKAVS